MFKGLYDAERAAESVAFLLHLAGGSLELIRLTKLIYLAERRSYETYGQPLTGDLACSLKHGPVLSSVYDATKTHEPHGEWAAWISGRHGHDVTLGRRIEDPEHQLLSLSTVDMDVLRQIWAEFGSMDKWALRDYTHDHCPEWKDPGDSSQPISISSLLRAVGMNDEQVQACTSELEQAAQLKSAYSKIAA
jgi:uncharacterized phage-associated protein